MTRNHEKNENTKTLPNTAYGKSKLEAEKTIFTGKIKTRMKKY